LMLELTAAVGRVGGEQRLRALIVTGAGQKSFIGGADINEMSELDPASARQFISRLHEACAALRNLHVPVIARIDGYCLGAGLEIAASCDLRIASVGSVFGMPEVRVGIPSVIEAALLPRLIGWGKSRELMLTGNQISAETAFEWGLVESVVPAADLDAGVDEWTDGILESGSRAVRLQKTLIRDWEKLSLDEAIERGIDIFSEAYKTDEPKILMSRFLRRVRPDGA